MVKKTSKKDIFDKKFIYKNILKKNKKGLDKRKVIVYNKKVAG